MKSDLAKNLENLRESRNWTKRYVADRLNIKTLSTYANWEYGTREPDTSMLIRIANLYDVSLDYLLGLTDNPVPIDKQDEIDFSKALSDPDLKIWWEELPDSSVEELRMLREMWEIMKKNKK